jgi:hypothetical protein
MSELPKPGVYPGIDYAIYASWDAMRSSVASKFERSAAHGRLALLDGDEPSASKELGSAVHLAILEPERLEKQCIVKPKADRRLKASREGVLCEAEITAWELEHAGQDWVSQDDLDKALRIRDAIWQKPWAQALLGSYGSNEVSVAWADPEFKLPCKARMDRLVHDYEGVSTIVELKSAFDASHEGFNRARQRFSYHVQAAMQVTGLDVLSPFTHRLKWLAIETAPPFESALYDPTPEMHAEGMRRFKGALAQYAEGMRTGYWPGYSTASRMLDLFPWEKSKNQGDSDDLY